MAFAILTHGLLDVVRKAGSRDGRHRDRAISSPIRSIAGADSTLCRRAAQWRTQEIDHALASPVDAFRVAPTILARRGRLLSDDVFNVMPPELRRSAG
jgi:hypothetical protein